MKDFRSNFLAGAVVVPYHYAGRIAFLQIMLFSLLILNYYSASVVSDRLKNRAEKMNDSLINLANSNLRIAAEPTPYLRTFLQVIHVSPHFFLICAINNIFEMIVYLLPIFLSLSYTSHQRRRCNISWRDDGRECQSPADICLCRRA